MQDFLNTLSGPNGELLVPVVMAVVGGIVAVCAIIMVQWRKHRLAEMEISLKQEMLQRGMSAEDIERVLAAGQTAQGQSCMAKPNAGEMLRRPR